MKQLVRIALLGAALFVLLAVLCLEGFLRFNNPPKKRYPVRGVDVSAYQGEIDWEALAAQEMRFAFVKATEGSSHRDAYFAANWENGRAAGLAVGAYHFFSYDSPGETQADNFIETVPLEPNALPPVVDIEFYGGNERTPPARDAVHAQLKPLLARLEQHYGRKPILYATGKSYALYLQGDFADFPIWIRNVLTSPWLPDNRAWTFWQYCDRGRLTGFEGGERFIDLNVFCGTTEDFEKFIAFEKEPCRQNDGKAPAFRFAV